MVSDGKDAYTIILSNESITIPCKTDGSFASGIFDSPYKYYTNVSVYRGATKLPLSLTNGWGLELPSGSFNLLPSQVGTDTWKIQIYRYNGENSEVSGSNIIRIRIYTGVYNVPTYTFDKIFSVSKAYPGPLLDWV